MHPFPHHYQATVKSGSGRGDADLSAPGLGGQRIAPPAEFGGTGADWSPETLLTGAVASCFVLGFKTIAEASKLGWLDVECRVDGTLDRIGHTLKFTAMALDVHLVVPDQRSAERAVRILQKAKESCLVTNSLAVEVSLQTAIEIVGSATG